VIATPFFVPVHFLEREDVCVADLRIGVKQLDQSLQILAAAPTDVVGNYFYLSGRGDLLSQVCGLA
jgi:hypothetical protein